MLFSELDYYAVLNITRCATNEEISLAYRKLAVQLCPFRDEAHNPNFVPLHENSLKTHMDPLSRTRQWEYLNMAYDILGNQLTRTIYDQYGEAGLFQGVLLPNGYFPPYQYHGDHMKVYKEAFGSYSPFANLMDAITNPPVLYSSKEHGIGVRRRDPPVEKIVPLELEEVRFGATKLMHVWRQEFCDAKQTMTEKRKKTLTLNIPPGTTPGTRFCFKEEGDRSPTQIPADIIFITADKPHNVFERRNYSDLVYTYEIDLCQALTGFCFSLCTLDRRRLQICITEVVNSNFTKIIPNEGLPKCKESTVEDLSKMKGVQEPTDFGDLILQFKIKFPTYLNKDMKTKVREFFNEFKRMECEALREDNPMDELIAKAKESNFCSGADVLKMPRCMF